MWIPFVIIGVCFAETIVVKAELCDDASHVACQILYNSKPDMCNETGVASIGGTCPKTCGKCPLQCYHCENSVTRFTDCTTTRQCNAGEVCMIRELQSTIDGHHEYMMRCESKRHCDGLDPIIVGVGKRRANRRNLSIRCCHSDLCNYPANRLSTPKPATTTGTPSSYDGNCYDLASHCPTYDSNICSTYPDWSKMYCARYCNLCSNNGSMP